MNWLTSLPAAVLVAGSLVVALLLAAGGRVFAQRIVPDGDRDKVVSIASPLMPALGAAFGLLVGITLSTEATNLRSASDVVSTEAAAASRLGWASTSPGVDSAPIQRALADYLRTTREQEWRNDAASDGTVGTGQAIGRLERVVRTEAADPKLGTPTSTELLASVDAVTSARRDRLAYASHQIPVLYEVVLLVGGMALAANAGALTIRTGLRTWLLVASLAVVIGLSMALLFSLSGPFRGPLIVSGRPIDHVVEDLGSGYFSR
jgi:hypothetical protein